jgi:hypothetical protein
MSIEFSDLQQKVTCILLLTYTEFGVYNIFVLNVELNFKRAMEKIYEHGLRELNREIEMENSLNPKSQLSILAAEITKGMNFYKIGLRIKEKMITKEPKFKIL